MAHDAEVQRLRRECEYFRKGRLLANKNMIKKRYRCLPRKMKDLLTTLAGLDAAIVGLSDSDVRCPEHLERPWGGETWSVQVASCVDIEFHNTVDVIERIEVTFNLSAPFTYPARRVAYGWTRWPPQEGWGFTGNCDVSMVPFRLLFRSMQTIDALRKCLFVNMEVPPIRGLRERAATIIAAAWRGATVRSRWSSEAGMNNELGERVLREAWRYEQSDHTSRAWMADVRGRMRRSRFYRGNE